MSIKVKNSRSQEIEFKNQRGPTCALYALSFVLEYLYDIHIPATADGGEKTSLRHQFKKDGKTVIGEVYEATPAMADYIQNLDSARIKCCSSECKAEAIKKAFRDGDICMVPFCVNGDGLPDCSGKNAHWCVVRAVNAEQTQLSVLHWGREWVFNLNELENSNKAIKNVPESWWGKDKDSSSLAYYLCSAEVSTEAKDEKGATHQIKPGSIKKIPAAMLESTLAGKMLIFSHVKA